MRRLGMVREAHSKWERRAPLTPRNVAALLANRVAQVLVQPSSKRIFADHEYVEAGAVLTDDLSSASVILGVKQIPTDLLMPDKTYMMFSHTMKGQPENMKLLDACLERNIRLIDYECVRRDGEPSLPRLIAFGEFAGKSGLINGLRGLGIRLLALGHSTPFLSIGPTYSYPDYSTACSALRSVGEQIGLHGLPAEHSPLVIGIVGTGNVSRGLQHALSQLGKNLQMVEPHDLEDLSKLCGTRGAHQHVVYGCVVPLEYVVQPEGAVGREMIDRSDYYMHPDRYRPVFHESIAPHISLLATTMYWDRRFPRLLTIDQLADIRSRGHHRLLAVADITCDVNGAVEMLVRSSSVEDPFYMYDVDAKREGRNGSEGNGVLMMGVDILPAELPREASAHFGEALLPFIEGLIDSNPHAPFETQLRGKGGSLPMELWAATICSNGKLTPRFEHIAAMRRANERQLGQRDSSIVSDPLLVEGSTVVAIHGDIFDYGVVNAVLDVVEHAGAHFAILETLVTPMQPSTMLLQLTLPQGREALDEVLLEVREVVEKDPNAKSTVQELPDYCKGVYDRTIARAASSTAPSLRGGPHFVVLGAGMCAGPAVEFLSRERAAKVTVVSALDGEADALALSLRRPNVKATTKSADPSDVDDWTSVRKLIASADGVLSLLPARMHPNVAAVCIQERKPLVTASYVCDAMAALDSQATAAGVPILCEMGLDPGMDHMSAVQLIAEAKTRGGVVTSFRSLCGGLPAPECADNPLMYKFSWSPEGVIAAAQNSATYREDGKCIHVPGESLLHSAVPLRQGRLGRVLNLEVLPNRNSLPYGEMYGIDASAATVFRGTLRYAGWSSLMADFRGLGLTDDTLELPQGVRNWRDLSSALSLRDRGGEKALECLQWLGAFDHNQPVKGSSLRKAFSALLQEKLAYQESERDAVFMEHTLEVQYPLTAGKNAERISSSLVVYGTPGETAMSKTVGITAAVGLSCLLRNEISLPGGVLRPTTPAVYKHCLDMLKKEGLCFVESTSPI